MKAPRTVQQSTVAEATPVEVGGVGMAPAAPPQVPQAEPSGDERTATTPGPVAPATESLAPTGPAFPVVTGYQILGELGRGGMGVVYQARQAALNRTVALKMIRDGILAGADQLTRFRLEAHAVARLQHPNIPGAGTVSASCGGPASCGESGSAGAVYGNNLLSPERRSWQGLAETVPSVPSVP